MKNTSDKDWKHWEDLPEEKEDELIEKIARSSVKRNFGLLTHIILESIGPFPSFFATLGMGLFGPYLELLGIDTYTALFRKRDNLKRLIKRIEELEEEKKEEERGTKLV